MSRPVHVVMPAGVRDPARPSGGNAYDVRVCAGLAARGWRVREHEVPGPWPYPGSADGARLAALVDSLPDGDVLLVDGLVGSTAPDVLERAAGRLRVVVLVHMPLGHASSAPEVADRERRALRATDVVVTSEWTRDWLVDTYRLDPREVRVATPGADPAPPTLGSAAGGRLLTVGPVSRGKGHDVLVAALGRLDDLDWRFVGVGSLDVDPDTATEVERWSVGRRRVRLTGPLVGADLEAAYASADLLVHPSRAETYGMVVTEALAHGIPVVATEVGGTGEAMGATDRSGRPGLLVPSGDVDGLAVALRAWLTDDVLRRRLRAAADERRRGLPMWDSTVAVVEDALSEASLAGAASGGVS